MAMITSTSPASAALTAKRPGRRSQKKGSPVTENRARAQRAKLEKQAEQRLAQAAQEQAEAKARRKTARQEREARRRSIETLIDAYLQDQIGGNRSEKTVEWHRIALGFFQQFLQEQFAIHEIDEVEADDISAWFTHLRATPGARGKERSERTVQTYARSARAFFHWLVRRGTLEHNPFDRVVFPKVGRPLIQTITDEEFERLLLACAPPHETSSLAERATVRNRAILWLLYDTGIRVSELTNLRVDDVDRKKGVITVLGKGSKERRIAMGQNCQRHLYYYLDQHRPDEEELAEWGSAGEDHLFLSETRLPLTKNGITLLFARLRKRAGISGRRVSPHILRHTFAIRYLVNGGDPFNLQELLGHEDMATVKIYMRMNDETIQEQKRKFSPGDHLPTRMPGPRQTRRTNFNARTGSPRARKR